MPSPTTIYECDDLGCGSIQGESGGGWDSPPDMAVCLACGGHCTAARVVHERDLLSDETIRALAAAVWEDPPDAFDDSDFDVLRDAVRAALGLTDEGDQDV